MVKQKGFLATDESTGGLAQKGVLVRHLILPGRIRNSIDALSSLRVEFGSELPVSLMSQYHPAMPHTEDDLNRKITQQEFERVYSHARELGFEWLFVQSPCECEENAAPASPFLPDFLKAEPFEDPGKEDSE
jgi:putative pyruvate formate lyase activating enzyme